ncbi:MAG: FxsA family protein [Salinisphaera sp.]|nr:FxsA family protein [Salinisphaera sp.]
MLYLLLLFIAVPLVETWLLIEVGSRIGALPTIGIVIATAVIGSQLVRRQGLHTMREIQACQRRGQLPAVPLAEGAILFVAGVLLVLPGLISACLGFLLLIPPLRRRLARQILRRALVATPTQTSSHDPQRRPDVIEGEYRRED